MAAPRRTRALKNKPPIYDTSDFEGTDQEDTPKPQRHVRKRLSEVYNPENDASFTTDSGRVPLKSVNINDDIAERRKRRKSGKYENALAGPSSEGLEQDGAAATPRAIKQKHLESVAPPQAMNVPLDVMSSNFEEWMKMATDNKINAANSWNFALIDYFHDMSLLRNNSDNSINFQRASCTLDGCVKIWTSRVDSVGTETGKLLSNLATEGNVDEEAGFDNPDAQDPTQQRKRGKTHRPESTLAKNAAQLRSKKLDLEFSVDPLFKKTCADFDEGGAQGLLINHLSLGIGTDGGMRVVFDASDSMGKASEDEEAELIEPEEAVDLSHLRKEFLPDLSLLDRKAISHSLAGFSFAKDAFSFDATAHHREDNHRYDDDDDDVAGNAGAGFGGDEVLQNGNAGGQVEDFFIGDQAVGDDFAGDMGMGFDDEGDEAGLVGIEGGQDGAAIGGSSGEATASDPRRMPNEHDLVMALTDIDGDLGMLDYFDQNFLKNWAGPEHWKLRKTVRRPETDVNAPKPKREKKEAFKLDFIAADERDLKDVEKELFAPVTRGAGINLPGSGIVKPGKKSNRSRKVTAKAKSKNDDHCLPDDMHFSSRQLMTLFLKPKFSLRMRGQRVPLNPARDGEVDENFWALAAAEQAAERATIEEGEETASGGAIPFNTQFFHDDDYGFDDVFDADGEAMGTATGADPGEQDQDLLAAAHSQARHVRPELVNYAKRAKRVDVKRLKENIWKGLDIVVEQSPRRISENAPAELTDPSEARIFGSVIAGLEKSYPKDKLEEISTSFCFICLLHLANERGLRLDSIKNQLEADDNEEEHAVEAKVGTLADIRIYRDPNAIRAA